MGVRDLWKILEPMKEPMDTGSLKGLTLAVDLSVWVCEAEGVQEMRGRVTKPYLRNLFFRVYNLQQLGVHLIFVVDGEAPELKLEEMSRRNQARFGGGHNYGRGRGRGNPGSKRVGRSHFKALLRECCELLELMGIPFVQSQGEAEAFCALLNKHQIADGCITNDGDAFLYGATTVYRNFTIDKKAQGNTADKYTLTDMEVKLNLDREKLIALGLLLGCDFVPKGVPGVGQCRAIKLMEDLPCGNTLERLCLWRSDRFVAASPIEEQIRQKSMCVQDFPSHKVISEFTKVKDKLPRHVPTEKRPKMFSLQRFLMTKLEWEEDYAFDKLLPLVTTYDLRSICKNPAYRDSNKCLKPASIVKARVKQFVPMYEVQWYKVDGDNLGENEYYVTLEEQTIFGKCFPQLVEHFEASKTKPKAAKKVTKKTNKIEKDEEESEGKETPISATPLASDCIEENTFTQLSSLSLANKPAQSRDRETSRDTDDLDISSSFATLTLRDRFETKSCSQKLQNNPERIVKRTVKESKQKPAVPAGSHPMKCINPSRVEKKQESRSRDGRKPITALSFLDDSLDDLLINLSGKTNKTTSSLNKQKGELINKNFGKTTNKGSLSVKRKGQNLGFPEISNKLLKDKKPGVCNLSYTTSLQAAIRKVTGQVVHLHTKSRADVISVPEAVKSDVTSSESEDDEDMLPLSQRILLRASQSSTDKPGKEDPKSTNRRRSSNSSCTDIDLQKPAGKEKEVYNGNIVPSDYSNGNLCALARSFPRSSAEKERFSDFSSDDSDIQCLGYSVIPQKKEVFRGSADYSNDWCEDSVFVSEKDIHKATSCNIASGARTKGFLDPGASELSAKNKKHSETKTANTECKFSGAKINAGSPQTVSDYGRKCDYTSVHLEAPNFSLGITMNFCDSTIASPPETKTGNAENISCANNDKQKKMLCDRKDVGNNLSANANVSDSDGTSILSSTPCASPTSKVFESGCGKTTLHFECPTGINTPDVTLQGDQSDCSIGVTSQAISISTSASSDGHVSDQNKNNLIEKTWLTNDCLTGVCTPNVTVLINDTVSEDQSKGESGVPTDDANFKTGLPKETQVVQTDSTDNETKNRNSPIGIFKSSKNQIGKSSLCLNETRNGSDVTFCNDYSPIITCNAAFGAGYLSNRINGTAPLSRRHLLSLRKKNREKYVDISENKENIYHNKSHESDVLDCDRLTYDSTHLSSTKQRHVQFSDVSFVVNPSVCDYNMLDTSVENSEMNASEFDKETVIMRRSFEKTFLNDDTVTLLFDDQSQCDISLYVKK